jgi:hypothetical protein
MVGMEEGFCQQAAISHLHEGQVVESVAAHDADGGRRFRVVR